MVIKKVMTSSGLVPYDTKRPTICRGEENILNLIPMNRILPPIPKRYTGYVSCFHPQAVIERRKNRHCRRTMGWALEPLKDPNCFLKKNCGIKQPSHCVTKYKESERLHYSFWVLFIRANKREFNLFIPYWETQFLLLRIYSAHQIYALFLWPHSQIVLLYINCVVRGWGSQNLFAPYLP